MFLATLDTDINQSLLNQWKKFWTISFVRRYVDSSNNFVVICMILIWQEHVFKIYSLINEKVASQHKDMTSQHKDLTSGRNMPP